MFEVGKRYKAVMTTTRMGGMGQIKKDHIYTFEVDKHDVIWRDESGKINRGWSGSCFYPTPIEVIKEEKKQEIKPGDMVKREARNNG